ncbi:MULTISPECIES: hypothetical protein [Bosea]|uniref:hypothetical protein n=1 Tax=Bosea TaxID=85413 RepID=UPI0021500D32|nr:MULTISPECIES: hypothetical protein [Bosea]MCR4521891.1 hypothetical protein [Bosea sp. 47.2.35]MDR6827416.1 hypothetical protein [Bosea robiniae]MDR6894126.1 hypothetical protein [Bosea sp. BE109]MDR7137521.1 hypothetical protein [Bosea sp. BE168]MDR7174221.1 hypothetical protein [Bosea sp. BE271]
MTISFSTSNWPVNLTKAYAATQAADDDSKQGAGASASSSASSSSTEAEFLKIARMTPEERVQAALLAKLGMTEEEFNKLDAQAKADVMTKIRDEMLKQMEAKGETAKKTGTLADISV